MNSWESEKKYPDILIGEHIRLINSSTSSRAMQKSKSGIRCTIFAIVFHPCFTLLKSLLIGGGVFRGIRSIINSILDAYEEFLTLLKLWEISNTSDQQEK